MGTGCDQQVESNAVMTQQSLSLFLS